MGSEDILQPGTVLEDRFEITKRLGGGGMGYVYLGQDKRLSNTRRAIKQMVVEFVDHDQFEKAVADFAREANVLASLDHPCIPTIYDYFLSTGYYYLVMKFVRGNDLEQIVKANNKKPLPERLVTKLGIQLCDVLQYIHSQDPPIIYRDMKPANIMYDEPSDRVTLIDFGIARFVSSSQAAVTAIGTVGYAPPELFLGKVVPATDIYSLGATLFNLVTGQEPQAHPVFGMNFANNPKPRAFNPELTEELEDIIIKATETRATNRFTTAAEMKYRLEEHLYRLDHPTEQVSASKGSGPTSHPMLIIVHSSSSKVGFFDLTNHVSAVIGRSDVATNFTPDIDILPYDNSGKISRRHAMISQDGTKYFFEDLGSANGSLYNNDRVVAKQRYELKSGDQVCVGDTVLMFSILGS